MRKIMILMACLQAAPLAAQSDCPTAGDLAKGIRFTLATGETETFNGLENGIVESLFKGDDPIVSRVVLGQGVYLMELIDLKDGTPEPDSRTTYSYPLKPAEMPVPQPGGHWAVTAAVLDSNGLDQEAQVYDFGTLTQATYGACSYDMLPITITYPGDEKRSDLLHYLPALGLSYLAGGTFDGQTDSYSYTDIEALP